MTNAEYFKSKVILLTWTAAQKDCIVCKMQCEKGQALAVALYMSGCGTVCFIYSKNCQFVDISIVLHITFNDQNVCQITRCKVSRQDLKNNNADAVG